MLLQYYLGILYINVIWHFMCLGKEKKSGPCCKELKSNVNTMRTTKRKERQAWQPMTVSISGVNAQCISMHTTFPKDWL